MGIKKKEVLFALISSLALNIENVLKKRGGGSSHPRPPFLRPCLMLTI